jgi:hypothetical protein
MVKALEQWFEARQPPVRIIASRLENDTLIS